MTVTVVAIFAIVYLGMILGGLPFLQLDRTGVALLGGIALVAIGVLTPEQAALSIHLPTLLLLFSFMVISAQMRLGGFYAWVTQHIAALPLGPNALLAAVIGTVAVLSAVFSNDIVCLAVAPVLTDACLRRGLDPDPVKRFPSMDALLAELGHDPAVIRTGMHDPEVDRRLAATRALAEALAISGTPTFVAGDRMLRGYLPPEAMQEVLAEVRAAD